MIVLGMDHLTPVLGQWAGDGARKMQVLLALFLESILHGESCTKPCTI